MIQEITLIGRLGQDPEMRYTKNGTAVTNFSLATSRKYTSNGEQVEEVTWWKVTVWRRQAETCNEFLHKGAMVRVRGRMGGNRVSKSEGKFYIEPNIWTGQDGEPRCQFEVNAQHVKFLDYNPDKAQAPQSNGSPEIPF
jgi:single-strand DNA-binding protein